jgi:hypothetical protein
VGKKKADKGATACLAPMTATAVQQQQEEEEEEKED